MTAKVCGLNRGSRFTLFSFHPTLPFSGTGVGGDIFYLTRLRSLYTDSTDYGILIEGPFRMSFRADIDYWTIDL